EKTKKPTGLLLEVASKIVTDHIPERSYADLKAAMRKAIHFAMEKGLTSVHTNDPMIIGSLAKTYQVFDELLLGEKLGLRCNLLVNHEFLDDLKTSGMY